MRWLKTYGGAFKDFTPDQLIDYQDQAQGKKRCDILDTVEDFIQSKNNLTYEYKRKQLPFFDPSSLVTDQSYPGTRGST